MARLDLYNKKRDFSKTKEPKGNINKSGKKLMFVIQHHLARRDHYDLRLECNGVLVSFAVPKGPSFNPKDKRLAVHVEDHPISYGDFEGVIPKGEYGAGPVMIFDKGYYTSLDNMDLGKGVIKFFLEGERFVGAWSLVHFKENNWLLIKEKDEYVKNTKITKYKTSVVSGKTMTEIKNVDNDVLITNQDKLIFKKEKITKGDIANFYKLVSKRMMPFLDNRLLSTVRCPSGSIKDMFFMKHLNSDSEDILKKKVLSKNGKKLDYYYIKNERGIIYEVQMNSYEFHIWGSKQNNLRHPDILVFDLDPDDGLNIKKVRDGVKDLKKILDEFNLKSYLKTSGGKGYHIYVPIIMSSWNKCEKIARDISSLMVSSNPLRYTTNMRKDKRKGKIFIDYFRNKRGATSVCPYSLRLKKGATVSCPIFWSELDFIKPNQINIKNIKDRLKKRDPWADFFNSY